MSTNIECVWPSCQWHHGRLLSAFLTMEQIYWIIRPGAVLMLRVFLKTQLQLLFLQQAMQRWSNWWRIDEAKVSHFANLVYVYVLGCVVCTVYTVLSFLTFVALCQLHQQYMDTANATVCLPEHIVKNTLTFIQANQFYFHWQSVSNTYLLSPCASRGKTKGVLLQVANRIWLPLTHLFKDRRWSCFRAYLSLQAVHRPSCNPPALTCITYQVVALWLNGIRTAYRLTGQSDV